MFSNKFRFLKILLPLIILFILLYYVQIKGPNDYPGFSEALKDSKNFVGKEINFGGKVIEVKDKSILVKTDDKKVEVNLALSKGNLNYDISGTAVFNPDKTLSPIKYHFSNLRKYKIVLSLIPLLVIIYLFFREYQFDFKRMIFLRKRIIKN